MEIFLLLKYICHRGAFRKDIIEKCVFGKTENDGIKPFTNNSIKLKKARDELIEKLNILDIKTKNKNY